MYASQCKPEETSNRKGNEDGLDAKRIKHEETVKNLARELNEGSGILGSGLQNFANATGSFFGNVGTNALGAITSGVSDAIHGRRGKKGNTST